MSKQNGKQRTPRLGILGVVELQGELRFVVKHDGIFDLRGYVEVAGVKYFPLEREEFPWEPPRISDYLPHIWPSEFGDRKLDRTAPWSMTSSP